MAQVSAQFSDLMQASDENEENGPILQDSNSCTASTPLAEPRACTGSARSSAKMFVKPEKYDGKGDWAEYISHFSDCAELGSWDDRTKCLVLAANLRDAARKYYAGLSAEEKKDYDKLTSALKWRFGGEHRQDSWLSKLEMRRRKPGEAIGDLGDDIWQMAQRAYYDFDHRSQEQLATFLQGH